MHQKKRLKESLKLKHPKDLFYGWWLVGVVWLIMGVIVGPIFMGLGVFFVALERQFNWSRTALSLAFSLSRIEGALFGPIEGYLADKIGVRRMVLIGLAILGIGLLLFSIIQNIFSFYAAMLIVFAGSGFAGFIPLMSLINNWFSRRKATATAIGLTGANLGGILVPLVALAVTNIGWRSTVRGLGLFVLLVSFPISRIIRNKPEEFGLLPDGEQPEPESSREQTSTSTIEEDDGSFNLRQAMRTGAFWAISIAHGLGATVFVTVAIHIVPAMTDQGISLQMAGNIMAVITSIAAISQLIGGPIGDRYPKRPLIIFFNILQGFSMFLAASARTTRAALIFAVPFGIGQGVRVPLLVAIRGDYFGRKHFATIFGVSQLPMNLLMLGAPVLAGYLFDSTGSYTIPFIGLGILNLLGGAFMLLVHKPKQRPITS